MITTTHTLCALLLFAMTPASFAQTSALTSDWKAAALAELPPKTEHRVYLKKALDEINEGQLEQGIFRLEAMVDLWEKDRADSGKNTGEPELIHYVASFHANLKGDFFSQAYFVRTLAELDRQGKLPDALRQRTRVMAEDALSPQERGPNNRSYHFAIANALASQLFPDSPQAARWRAYAEAVWSDFAVHGDTYEPGYVIHNLPPTIELAGILGKTDQLTSPHIRPMFERFRDHVSPSGLVIDPGDGASQVYYRTWLPRYAEISGDGTFLWAAERVIEAGEAGGYRGAFKARPSAEIVAADQAKLLGSVRKLGIEARIPDSASGVEFSYPNTFRIPDRLILNPSRAPGHPYAAFYLNDTAETLHHAHEDNRGELFHYEADGVMLLRRSSWHKPPGQTNTFVVGDSSLQFPWNQDKGFSTGHWYRADANIRPIRLSLSDDVWTRRLTPESVAPYDRNLEDAKTGLGYRYDNPRGYSGELDRITPSEITISINAFPLPGGGAWGKTPFGPDSPFRPGVGWVRDYRPVAPSETPIIVRLANLRLTGRAGGKLLSPLDQLANVKLHFFPVDQPKITPPQAEIPRDRFGEFLRVVTDDKRGTCIEATCPPGRLDILVPTPGLAFDLTKEFSRMGFDYLFVSDSSKLLRPPIGLFIDGVRFRSLLIDNQQGGIFLDAATEQRGKDVHGSMRYEGVWTADSNWTRRAILTEEGILAVLDIFSPGATADGMVAGPVWQFPTLPSKGRNWFAAEVDPITKTGLLVWMMADQEAEFGHQLQEKLWRLKESAVFAKSTLQANKPARFFTLCIPYAAKDGSRATAARVLSSQQLEDGFEVEIAPMDGSAQSPLRLRLTDSDWAVTR